MPRFYFNVRDRFGGATDHEGAELPCLETAMVRAAEGARSMMSDSVRRGELDFTAAIEIEDEQRVGVARLAFAEAVTIHR